MRPLKLYVKKTILASAVTIAVLAVMQLVLSVRVARFLQEREKEVARMRAQSLARHIMDSGVENNLWSIKTSALLVQNDQKNVLAVRLWGLNSAGVWRPLLQVGEPADTLTLSANLQNALAKRQAVEMSAPNEVRTGARFNVYEPLYDEWGQVFGAIEIKERLDSPTSVVARFVQSEAGLMIVAIALITGSSYFIFGYFVQRPLNYLLAAMERARNGELTARAPVLAQDEMGEAARQFNQMLAHLEEVTREREAYQETLQARVREATSELQRRNEELAAANLEVWRTSRRLIEVERLAVAGQTAAQLAHEVGTPLNLIGGHVQLLRLSSAQSGSQTTTQRLDIVIEQIERIERIVRQTLDRTRIDRSETATVDLAEITRRTLSAAASLLAERKVKVKEETATPLPLISANPDHLQQVLLNLANNSLDAMPDGGDLSVRLTAADGYVVLDFADNGCGMSQEVQARIFEPLFTTKERGTGLGLVIVRQLVQEAGGTVEVESAPGQGTLVRLRFPAINPDKAV
jgi:signal transduction histidine kinase